MKKYTRTQEVEAIQWTQDNKMEIQEALGGRFDIDKTFLQPISKSIRNKYY